MSRLWSSAIRCTQCACLYLRLIRTWDCVSWAKHPAEEREVLIIMSRPCSYLPFVARTVPVYSVVLFARRRPAQPELETLEEGSAQTMGVVALLRPSTPRYVPRPAGHDGLPTAPTDHLV